MIGVGLPRILTIDPGIACFSKVGFQIRTQLFFDLLIFRKFRQIIDLSRIIIDFVQLLPWSFTKAKFIRSLIFALVNRI